MPDGGTLTIRTDAVDGKLVTSDEASDVPAEELVRDKGGNAIPYRLEDAALRKEYEDTLAREGMTSRMNPELYTGAAADDEGGGP